MIYQSRQTAQFASYNYPRILLPVENSRVIYALAGNPNDPSYGSVERLEYDQSGDWIPKRFHFTPQGAVEIPFQENATYHSKTSFCSSCHGKFLHPNWDSYPDWPGVYGSRAHEDDRWLPPDEVAAWKKFQNGNAKTGLYAELKDLPTIDLKTLSKNNVKLGREIHLIRMSQLAREIVQTPSYPKYEAAILSALLADSEENFLKFLDEPDRLRYLEVRGSLDQSTQTALRSYFKNKKIPRHEVEGKSQGTWILTKLRFLLEDRMGLDMSEWPISLKTGTYVFEDGFKGLNDLLASLVQQSPVVKRLRLQGGFRPSKETRSTNVFANDEKARRALSVIHKENTGISVRREYVEHEGDGVNCVQRVLWKLFPR